MSIELLRGTAPKGALCTGGKRVDDEEMIRSLWRWYFSESGSPLSSGDKSLIESHSISLLPVGKKVADKFPR